MKGRLFGYGVARAFVFCVPKRREWIAWPATLDRPEKIGDFVVRGPLRLPRELSPCPSRTSSLGRGKLWMDQLEASSGNCRETVIWYSGKDGTTPCGKEMMNVFTGVACLMWAFATILTWPLT